jgi:hypothetical protein
VALIATMAAQVWQMITHLHRASLVNHFSPLNLQSVNLAAAQSADNQVRVSSLAYLITLVICGVLFIVWLHQLSTRVHAARPGTPRYSTGWAVGGWFVPILNLARPVQVVTDVWRSATTSGNYAEPVPARFGLWWAVYLTSNVVSTIAVEYGTSTLSAIRNHDRLIALAAGLSVLAAVFAIVVVRALTARVAVLPLRPPPPPLVTSAEGMNFNPPPGWPVPPPGWSPPYGWMPDPTWPPAPAGWQFWLRAPYRWT